jgi:hypothetical protein
LERKGGANLSFLSTRSMLLHAAAATLESPFPG